MQCMKKKLAKEAQVVSILNLLQHFKMSAPTVVAHVFDTSSFSTIVTL